MGKTGIVIIMVMAVKKNGREAWSLQPLTYGVSRLEQIEAGSLDLLDAPALKVIDGGWCAGGSGRRGWRFDTSRTGRTPLTGKPLYLVVQIGFQRGRLRGCLVGSVGGPTAVIADGCCRYRGSQIVDKQVDG